MEHLSLKPNRELLNAKFDSYHLGIETLELKSLSLLQPVAYYPIKEDHYSFSHLRAHASQNLLTLDPWNENKDVLYFADASFAVMGLAFNNENSTFGSPVKMCQFPVPLAERVKEHVCPSISFPCSQTCLFNDGAGKLYMINTGRRDNSIEKQKWNCNMPTEVYNMDTPFYVCAVSIDSQENIYCTVMSLEDEKSSKSNHPMVSLHCLEMLRNNKESSSAGDEFVVNKTKEMNGSSVPTYVSYSPDFSSLIIASQGKFKLAEKTDGDSNDGYDNSDKNGLESNSVNDKGNTASRDVETTATMVMGEVERQSSAYTSEQIEECDMETEDNLELFVINKEDGNINLHTQLSGHQWLFNMRHNPIEPTYFCVRHDVDGLLWKPVTADNNALVSWKHVTTFNALGYIQASKKNHKYVTSSETFGFVAIVDCVRNIYIYVTKSVSASQGTQYVLELPTSDEVLGVQASSDTLFVLSINSVFAIKVL